MYRIKGKISLFLSLLLAVLPNTANAASASSEAKRAGKFYKEGKYDEALEKYDKALEIAPDDYRLHYNRGSALYRKGDFPGAEGSFLKSLATDEEGMEEKSIYNAGNSKYRAGEALEKTDPNSALKNYKEALQYYRRSIDAAPEDMDAKYNYEFTLNKIKDLEKQSDQKQQQQDQQEQQDQEQQKQDQQQQKDQEQQKQDQQQQKQQQQQQQEALNRQKPDISEAQLEDIETPLEQETRESEQQTEELPQPEEDTTTMASEEARMILEDYRRRQRTFMEEKKKQEQKYSGAKVIKNW